jgi:ribonuclease HII
MTIARLLKYDRTLIDLVLGKEIRKNFLLIGLDEVGRGCLAGPVCTAAYYNRFFCENQGSASQASVNRRNFCREIRDLNDSKKVPKSKHEILCKALTEAQDEEILWSVDFKSAEDIDRQGIVACIYDSMSENIAKILLEYFQNKGCYPQIVIVLIDGPTTIKSLQTKINHRKEFIEIEFHKSFSAKREVPGLLLEIIRSNLYETEKPLLLQIPIIKGDTLSASIAAASNIAKHARDQYMLRLANEYPDYSWDTNVGYGTQRHFEAIQKLGINEFHRKSFLYN